MAQVGLLLLTVICTGLTYYVFHDQLGEMREQHRDAVEASKQQHADTTTALGEAADANAIAREQMRRDQRAWIQYMLGDEKPEVAVGKRVAFRVMITNIGKTVARQVHGWVAVEKLSFIQSPSFNRNDPLRINVGADTGLLFPSHVSSFELDWRKNDPIYPLDDDRTTIALASDIDVRDWREGKFYFAVFGKIDYRDIFEVPHWTTFCSTFTGVGTLDRPPMAAGLCKKIYNNVDDNK